MVDVFELSHESDTKGCQYHIKQVKKKKTKNKQYKNFIMHSLPHHTSQPPLMEDQNLPHNTSQHFTTTINGILKPVYN